MQSSAAISRVFGVLMVTSSWWMGDALIKLRLRQ
jgi:hypothetical protein